MTIDENTHLSFYARGQVTAAHTHTWFMNLLTALVEDRDPFPNAAQSANWTSVGILGARIGHAGWQDHVFARVLMH